MCVERCASEGSVTVGVSRGRLARVREDGAQKVCDVTVGERVEHVFALAASDDEVLGSKHAEALRDGREVVAGELRDLRHAELALQKKLEQTQSRGVTRCAKEPCCPSERRCADACPSGRIGVRVWGRLARRGSIALLHHRTVVELFKC